MSGLVRVYVTARDGRRMTVRYVLAFRPSVVQRAAERDARVARALVDELSERVLSFIAEIPGSAFATVRQRVARHLLDLASESQRGSELLVAIGQQDLADAVGSVREVVVRALRDLRQQGLVETRRDGIVLLDPERLLGVADAGEAGTSAPVRR